MGLLILPVSLIVFLFISAFIVLMNAVIFKERALYCYIYDHKDWKLWNYNINNVDKFKFEYKYNGNYYFSYKDVKAILWNDGMSSIHESNDSCGCILCTFNTYKSKEFSTLLKQLNSKVFS